MNKNDKDLEHLIKPIFNILNIYADYGLVEASETLFEGIETELSSGTLPKYLAEEYSKILDEKQKLLSKTYVRGIFYTMESTHSIIKRLKSIVGWNSEQNFEQDFNLEILLSFGDSYLMDLKNDLESSKGKIFKYLFKLKEIDKDEYEILADYVLKRISSLEIICDVLTKAIVLSK